MKEHKLGFTEEENLEIFKFFDQVGHTENEHTRKIFVTNLSVCYC